MLKTSTGNSELDPKTMEPNRRPSHPMVAYSKYGGQRNEVVLVRSMNEVEGLSEVWLQCIAEKDLAPFGTKCKIAHLYIDNFDPNFIARTFVLNKILETDNSSMQLVLLQAMKYTRWDEVRYIVQHGEIKFDEGVLTPAKRYILRELNIID